MLKGNFLQQLMTYYGAEFLKNKDSSILAELPPIRGCYTVLHKSKPREASPVRNMPLSKATNYYAQRLTDANLISSLTLKNDWVHFSCDVNADFESTDLQKF